MSAFRCRLRTEYTHRDRFLPGGSRQDAAAPAGLFQIPSVCFYVLPVSRSGNALRREACAVFPDIPAVPAHIPAEGTLFRFLPFAFPHLQTIGFRLAVLDSHTGTNLLAGQKLR